MLLPTYLIVFHLSTDDVMGSVCNSLEASLQLLFVLLYDVLLLLFQRILDVRILRIQALRVSNRNKTEM